MDRVSLRVDAGEVVCLLGPNGAGKTTLIRMAATLARPHAGALRFRGADLRKAGPEIRGRIGFASHASLLYPDLTVAENLRFHARLHVVRRPLGPLLARHGLEAVADVPARHLSRGTAQRAAVARAVLHEPELLLLDEPFSGLDEAAAEAVIELLRDFRARGAGVLVTTHEVERGLSVADRAAVLHRGRLILDDPCAPLEVVRGTYRDAAAGRGPGPLS